MNDQQDLFLNMQNDALRDKSNEQKTGDAPLDGEKSSNEAANSLQGQQKQEDDPIYPGRMKLALVILALNLSIFCVGVDNTIISSAIPKITDHFNALGDVGWYGSAYLLTNCSFQLSWGKLFTFYSIKWTYLAALSIFELGSLICGVAPTSTALIVGRAIAGVGAGGVSSGAFLLVVHSVPARQRPTLIGMVGGMYGFASIAGPLMGGAFTSNANLTWRWCFYINLPLGVITGLCVIFFVHVQSGKKDKTLTMAGKVKQMDLLGFSFLFPGIICLLLALQWGGTKYEWKNGRIIALLILAGILSIGFIVIQIRSGDQATVPPRVFSNRNIWGSALFGGCVVGCFYVMLYYIPIWFQAIKGVSAVESGVRNLPLVLSFVVFSFLGGILTSVTGHYVQFVYLTVTCMAIGSGLLSTLKVDSGREEWIGYQVIFGAGIGFGLQSALTAAQTALTLHDVPIGTATIMFAENLAGAIMVSVAQNVFTNQLTKNLGTHVPTIDPRIILSLGATEIKGQVAPKYYGAVLVAYNISLMQTFYVGVALACCSAFGAVWLQWLSVKEIKPDAVETV